MHQAKSFFMAMHHALIVALALPAATKEYLHSRGITMDVRPTPSAAYTFGVLREEGRAVAAALFPMGKGSMDGGRSGIYSDARG